MSIVECTCYCGCNNKFKIPEIGFDTIPALLDDEVLEQIRNQICSDCIQDIHYEQDSKDNALEILKKRLARGEISIDEYDEIRSRF